MPLDTRDCQPRCQHTLTQLSFTSHHPPRLPPVKLCAQGIYARSHNVPSRSTAFPLGSSTPPPRMLMPPRRRVRSAPRHTPALLFPTAAANQRRSPHARGRHTHSACARDARQRDCNGRSDDTNALAASPGSSAVASVWCRERAHACSVVLGSFRAPRLPVSRARLCMYASVGRALRLASARVSESGPSMCQSHAQRGGGVCANRSACLLALVI